MSCDTCPAAYLVEGATPSDRVVLCRVESTTAGQRRGRHAAPVSLVRERTSPASLHGYCLHDLRDFCEDVDDLGPLATDEQRRIADAARAMGGDGPGYIGCPSWQAEHRNRLTRSLVDQPGARRTYGREGIRAA